MCEIKSKGPGVFLAKNQTSPLLTTLREMSSAHIILAGEDPDDCLIFSQLAKEVNDKVEIICLTDCESLVRYLDDSLPPELIFLDLNMPLLSGMECLQKIKENLQWKDIPLIIYSTASSGDIIQECYNLGARLYIVKPDSTDKLKEIFSWLIGKFVLQES